jgi:Polysaccharide lyase
MKKNYFSLVIVLLAIFSCNSPINVFDDFEAPTLKRIWSTERMELRSFEIQSEVVRRGKHAAKITLRTGDMVEEANDTSAASERDELLEADDLYAIGDKKYEYQFSLFIPDSFPIVPTRLIIAQWKQKCPAKSCSDDSPVLAIRFQSGKLMIT